MKHLRKNRMLSIVMMVVLLLATTSIALADKPVSFDNQGNENGWEQSNNNCTKIQSGQITDTAGNPLSTGYDENGYNYQAHMFNGTYDSVDRNLDGTYWGSTGDYVDDTLTMKWSDEWLSNVDCDDDGNLDRGLVNGVAGGTSLGWTTNHVVGDYVDDNGELQHYTYFVKIVWTGPDSPLWNEYTIIEEVFNDPADGYTGLYSKIGAPGFGLNDQWSTLP
jgi:hypothetical protein